MKTLILTLTLLPYLLFAQTRIIPFSSNPAGGAAPDAPTNIAATNNDTLQTIITWTEADNPDSIGIYAGTTTEPTTLVATIQGGLNTYTYIVAEEDSYYVRVKGKEGAEWSVYSVEDTAGIDSANIVPYGSDDFATDGTGYYNAMEFATIAWDGADSTAVVTCTATFWRIAAYKASIPGRVYRVTFRAKSATLTDTYATLNFTWVSNPALDTDWQEYEGYFTADGSDYFPNARIDADRTGESYKIDNINCRIMPE